MDANIWGRSIEAGPLEDPWQEPAEDVFAWTADPHLAPEEGLLISLGFEHGIPVTLDGERLTGDILVTRLNALAGAHGVGRIDHVENRLVGIKSREIYEAPAAVVLHAAHTALETLTLGRDVFHLKRRLGDEWARLVYDGLWFGQLRSALAAFVAVTQEPVSGEVKLRLWRGTVSAVGRRAPGSLYREELATYDRRQDTFDHSAARGFIELFGLPLRTQARIQGALEDSVPLSLERKVKRR